MEESVADTFAGGGGSVRFVGKDLYDSVSECMKFWKKVSQFPFLKGCHIRML